MPDTIKTHTAKPMYQKRASIMQHRDDATMSARHVQTMFGCRRKLFKIEADKKWLAPFDDRQGLAATFR
jgi:hypothetical protein